MVSTKKVSLETLTARSPRWGEPGAAIVPRTLRAALGQQELPKWLADEAGLPEDATVAALGTEVWGMGLQALSKRIELYVCRLLESRRRDIEKVRALDRPWPLALEPEDVRWARRTRNCLVRARLLDDRLTLGQVTYGDLLAIPQMGVKTALDFAVTAEAAIDALHDGAEVPRELLELAKKAANAPWAQVVSEEDPRFEDILSKGGTLAERLEGLETLHGGVGPPEGWSRLAEVLPAVLERIERIGEWPLDDALRDYVSALGGLSGARLDALVARLGLDGQPPRTLQQAGDMLGVSRERIRQLQTRVTDKLPSHPVYMPALDRALELVASAAPASSDEAARLLRAHGVTRATFHPASVLAAARLCGRPRTFEIEQTPKGTRVVTTPILASAAQITLAASRQSDAFGASNLAELISTLSEQGMEVSEDEVRDVLRLYSDAAFLADDWFWMPNKSPVRNRLYNVSRRILAVASPLGVGTIRDGARRSYRFREVALIPPRDVMTAYYDVHPAFIVRHDGRVGSAEPLDYRRELGRTEQIFVDVLRSSPAGVLDRSSFQQACETRGMNMNTFSVYTTYSPVLEHLGTDLWSLRGIEVSPAAVAALRQANAARPRERVIEDYGWSSEGALWIAARVPRWHNSLVIGVPSAIAHYVADRRFSARAEDGSAAGTIVIGEGGTSWGYGPFLARRGADEGDMLLLKFYLASGEVILKLGDDQLLEDVQGA